VVPFFLTIPSGRHLRLRGVTRSSAEVVAFRAEGEVPYQLDGDPAGTLPVTARATSERLGVLVPE
jgi:diacylglycerol kinase family enzyme